MNNVWLNSEKKLKLISELFIFVNVLSYFLSLYEGMQYVIFAMLFINFSMVLLFNFKITRHLDVLLIGFTLLLIILTSKNTEYIIIFVTALFFSQLDYKVVTRRLAFYSICFFLLFVFFRLNEYQVYTRGDGAYRYDLGFINPNILAKYALGLIVSLYVLKLNVASGFLGLTIGFVSGSRTLILATVIYPLMLTIIKQRLRVVNFILLLLFPILTAASIFIALQSAMYLDIDRLLSFRPRGWLIYLNEYGFSLFGKTILFKDDVALDNSYLNIFISLGFFGSFCFSLFYYFLIRKLIRMQQFVVLSCLVLTLVYSFFENVLKYPLFNIATILAIVLSYKYNDSKP